MIRVEGPDGAQIEFPDGTDPQTMKAAMAKRYGGPSQPPLGAAPAAPVSPPTLGDRALNALGSAFSGAVNPLGTALGGAVNPFGELPDETRAMEALPLGLEAQPSLFRMDSKFSDLPGVGPHDMAWAALKDTFGTRQGAAEYLAGEAGGRVAATPEGDPAVLLGDTAYRMNDPGIDSTDVAGFLSNVGAFAMPATHVAKLQRAKQAGLGSRMLGQGTAAAATDTGLQLGFDGGRIDPTRTAITAAGGAGGEALGTGLNALVGRIFGGARTAPVMDEGALAKMVSESGADPSMVGKLRAMMGQIEAGADPKALLGQAEHGFQYTLGQRLTDPARKMEQLSAEELLRQTPQGHAVFEGARQNNVSALDNALAGIANKLGAKPGVAPAELVQGAQQTLKGQADELGGKVSAAYDKAAESGRTAITADAVKAMPERLQGVVRDFALNATLHPAAHRTLQQIQQGAQAITGGVEGAKVSGVTLKALETQRRIINSNFNAAANDADRAAMRAIKGEFDSWMDDAMDNALASGDPAALQAFKEARGLRTEFARRFEGKGDTDKLITGLIDGTRTPEELLNVALGASQVSKASGARFVERLGLAAQDDPAVMGPIRGALLQRLTRSGTGEALQPGQIVRNIRTTEESNASILKALYPGGEWKEIRRLADALEPLVAKGDFAKSAGTSERGMRMFRMLLGRIGGSLGTGALDMITGAAQGAKATKVLTDPVTAAASKAPVKTFGVGAATGDALMGETQR